MSNDNNPDGVYWKRRCEIAEAMLSGVRKAMNEAREQNRILVAAMAVNLAVEALENMPKRGFRTDNA